MSTEDQLRTMQPDEFRDLLDRHGPEAGDWPAADRIRAEALLARDAGARRDLQAARQLDLLLADALQVHDTAAERALAERIVAQIETTPRPLLAELFDRLLAFLWPANPASRLLRPIALAVLPLAVGYAAGVGSASSVEDFDDWSQAAFVASVDLTELAAP